LLKRLTSVVHCPERKPGQGVVEYALILVGVSTATEIAIQSMGQRVADVFNAIGSSLSAS
jgi:Flp pilus assembly pilin Flp